MLAPSMVAEIRRLLAEDKLSQRKIAKLTGISRGTVGAIASGKRRDYEPRADVDDEFARPSGPPQRCETCGGMVYMPCRLCALRKRLDVNPNGGRRDSRVELPLPLELELRPEHQWRYEEVRAWREEAERLEMEWIESGEMDLAIVGS